MATSWTADFTFTVDSLNYTADGAILTDSWRADTDHFTVDDDLYHTADGWHQDEEPAEKAIWGPGLEKYLQADHLHRLQREDEMILRVIEEFLEEAA